MLLARGMLQQSVRRVPYADAGGVIVLRAHWHQGRSNSISILFSHDMIKQSGFTMKPYQSLITTHCLNCECVSIVAVMWMSFHTSRSSCLVIQISHSHERIVLNM